MAEKAVREFLQRGRDARLLERSPSLLQAAGSVKAGSAGFSSVGGWTVTASGRGFGAEVSVSSARVVSFTVNGEGGPLWLGAPRRRENTAKLVPIQDAREVALNFLKTYVGQNVLDGMKEDSPTTGKGPIANFLWARQDWGSEVCWGIVWEEVWVDRRTAKVVKYHHREQVPDKNPRVTPQRARHIASAFLAAAGTKADILGLAYLPSYLPDGGVRYLWVVRYKKRIFGGTLFISLEELYLDAMTGEVVPDPTWLGKDDLMYQDGEKRIRAVTQKMKKHDG